MEADNIVYGRVKNNEHRLPKRYPPNMKIGLVRHFKVKLPFPKKTWLTRSEIINWFHQYELTEVENREVDLCGIDWNQCYSSSLNRAVTTARKIYDGKIVVVNELRELDILHLLPNGIKLPFMAWGILVRIKSLSSNKDTDEFRTKITNFIDELLLKSDGNVLVVSHWFVMRIIRKELLKRGLSGDTFKSSDYGTLYVYEKEKTTKR